VNQHQPSLHALIRTTDAAGGHRPTDRIGPDPRLEYY